MGKVQIVHYRVVQFKQENPSMSLRKIGEIFGISGERVRQICSIYHVETKRVPVSHPCIQCSKLIIGNSSKKFCSELCWFNFLYIDLICDYCSEVFYRRRTDVIKKKNDPRYTGRIYCSRLCSAKSQIKNSKEESKDREL